MLNHKFTAREAGVILLLVAVILGYIYYYVVYQYFEDQMAKYDTAELEDEIAMEQAKIARLNKMKQELESGDVSSATLGVYNNQSEEILALSEILDGKASDISISWNDPELDGTMVRRDVIISFTTGNLVQAGEIIKDLSDCKYSLLIVDLSMDESTYEEEITNTVTAEPTVVPADDETSEDLAEDVLPATTTVTSTVTKKATNVTVTLRFFETTNGAENLNGLELPTPAASIEDDLLEDSDY